MAEHHSSDLNVKPGNFISWILPFFVIVALITFLSVFLSQTEKAHHTPAKAETEGSGH